MNDAQRGSLDGFIQTNPAFALMTIRWMAEGYETHAKGIEGAFARMLSIWGVIGLALLAPTGIRARLPLMASARLRRVVDVDPLFSFSIPLAARTVAGPAWKGICLGVATKTLALEKGRLRALGEVTMPADEVTIDLRKRSRALGGILVREGSDHGIASALGIVVSP